MFPHVPYVSLQLGILPIKHPNTYGHSESTCMYAVCNYGNNLLLDTCWYTQVWNEQDPEEEVLAMVVRTGLYTSMGSMMRQVISYSQPEQKNIFLRVSFVLCGPIHGLNTLLWIMMCMPS